MHAGYATLMLQRLLMFTPCLLLMKGGPEMVKRSFLSLPLAALLIALFLAACSSPAEPLPDTAAESQYIQNDAPEEPTPAVSGRPAVSPPATGGALYAFDIGNKRLTVGFSDYTFVGTVLSYDDVKYVQISNGAEPVYEVRTLVSVQVEANIKGELVTDKAVQFWAYGGPSKEGIRYLKYADVNPPAIGDTFVLLLNTDENGELVHPGGGATYRIGSRANDPAEEFAAKYSSVMDEYREAYANEDTTYHPKLSQTATSIYDVNYKGE